MVSLESKLRAVDKSAARSFDSGFGWLFLFGSAQFGWKHRANKFIKLAGGLEGFLVFLLGRFKYFAWIAIGSRIGRNLHGNFEPVCEFRVNLGCLGDLKPQVV